MAEATQFTIGAKVSCRDGECGKVIRLVVNPVLREVTHIVVEPKHREGIGRLVPLALVGPRHDTVALSCTLAEFEALDFAEETHFLPGSGLEPGYTSSEVLVLPYYGLGPGNVTPPVTTDTLPLGEVACAAGRDRACHRRRDRAGAGTGHRAGQPSRDARPSPGGPPLGTQRSGDPHRIRSWRSRRARLRLSLTKQEVEDLPRGGRPGPDGHRPGLT